MRRVLLISVLNILLTACDGNDSSGPTAVLQVGDLTQSGGHIRLNGMDSYSGEVPIVSHTFEVVDAVTGEPVFGPKKILNPVKNPIINFLPYLDRLNARQVYHIKQDLIAKLTVEDSLGRQSTAEEMISINASVVVSHTVGDGAEQQALISKSVTPTGDALDTSLENEYEAFCHGGGDDNRGVDGVIEANNGDENNVPQHTCIVDHNKDTETVVCKLSTYCYAVDLFALQTLANLMVDVNSGTTLWIQAAGGYGGDSQRQGKHGKNKAQIGRGGKNGYAQVVTTLGDLAGSWYPPTFDGYRQTLMVSYFIGQAGNRLHGAGSGGASTMMIYGSDSISDIYDAVNPEDGISYGSITVNDDFLILVAGGGGGGGEPRSHNPKGHDGGGAGGVAKSTVGKEVIGIGENGSGARGGFQNIMGGGHCPFTPCGGATSRAVTFITGGVDWGNPGKDGIGGAAGGTIQGNFSKDANGVVIFDKPVSSADTVWLNIPIPTSYLKDIFNNAGRGAPVAVATKDHWGSGGGGGGGYGGGAGGYTDQNGGYGSGGGGGGSYAMKSSKSFGDEASKARAGGMGGDGWIVIEFKP